MQTFISGMVAEDDYNEGTDLVFVGSDPLARHLEDFADKQVWVAYAFDTAPITSKRFVELAIASAEGLYEGDFGAAWSQITGFLWMNEVGKVGGHDLIEIFRTHTGEYGAILIDTAPLDLTMLAEIG